MQYIGDIVADFIHLGALDIVWLCDEAKKLMECDSHLIPGLIELTILSVIGRHGLNEARSTVGGNNTSKLIDLLGGEKWNEISENLK